MADLEAIQRDIEHVLRMIPTEVVQVVAELAGKVLHKYRDQLPQIAATAYFKLQPHAKALGLELASGIMEVKELEPILTQALENVVSDVSHAKAG